MYAYVRVCMIYSYTQTIKNHVPKRMRPDKANWFRCILKRTSEKIIEIKVCTLLPHQFHKVFFCFTLLSVSSDTKISKKCYFANTKLPLSRSKMKKYFH